MVIAGGVLIATGVGGPAGMMLIGAGADTIIQKATTGQVNWGEVAVSGAIGAVGGGAAMWATRASQGGVAALRTTMIVNAGVNTLGAETGYVIKNQGHLTVQGALAVGAGGALSGAIGGAAGPAGGTIARQLGQKSTGLLAQGATLTGNFAGGFGGSVLADRINGQSINVGNALISGSVNGVGGAATAHIAPSGTGMSTLNSTSYFGPRTLNGVLNGAATNTQALWGQAATGTGLGLDVRPLEQLGAGMATARRVVRTPATAKQRPPQLFDVVVVALCLGVGVVLPLTRGVGVAAVLGTTVLGAVLAGGAANLPGRLRAPGVLAVLVVGALAGSLLDVSESWFLTWVMAVFLGVVVGADLAYWVRQRTVTRTGTRARPVPDPPPRALRGLRVMWDEGDDDCESADPDDEQVLECVHALDGRTRTFVSVFRDRARLDVGGDAAGAMVVFCSDDRRHWHQVRTPASPASDVMVGRQLGHYPTRETTDLASALTAVTTWLRDGTRDPGLAWHAATRHDDVVRPPSLEATD